MPNLTQDGQAAPVELARALQSPGLVEIQFAVGGMLLYQAFANLLMPCQPALGLQVVAQPIREAAQVAAVVQRVVHHLLGQRPARPVGLLRSLVEGNAEQLGEQVVQAECREAKQPRRPHRVEDRCWHEPGRGEHQPQVVVGAVHEQFLPLERLEQRRDFQRGEGVDQHIRAGEADLQQAQFFRIRVQAVGFRVEADPVRFS